MCDLTRPPGCCPVCGYATGTGRCPECGSIIFREKLLDTYTEYRRRRMARTFRRWLWIPLLLGAASYTYYYIDWIAWIPTSALLASRDQQHDSSSQELMRRFDNGTLSSSQREDLRVSGLRMSFRVDERTPYPAGVPLLVRVALGLQLPNRVWGLEPGVPVLELKGQVVVRAWLSGEVLWRGTAPEKGERLVVPGLSSGSYQIGVSGTVRLKTYSWEPVIYTWPVAMDAVVVVETQRVSDFVKPVLNATWRTEVARTLGIAFYRPSWLFTEPSFRRDCIVIGSLETCVPIAGTLWVRAENGTSYVQLPKPFVASCEDHTFIADLPVSGDFEQSSVVDVRVLPDPSLAFAAHFDEYFGGIIEWADVPIEHALDPPRSGVGGLLPTSIRKGLGCDPDEIIEGGK